MSSSRTRPKRPLPDRVGSALILVLIMTAGLAALAMSAIFMASSSGLMTQYSTASATTATRRSRRCRSG